MPASAAARRWADQRCRPSSGQAEGGAGASERAQPNLVEGAAHAAALALRDAVRDRAEAERAIQAAMATARERDLSWSTIGLVLGTSGEAARQCYGAGIRAP